MPVASCALAALGEFVDGPGVSEGTVVATVRQGGTHGRLAAVGIRYSMASLVPKLGSPGGVGIRMGGGSLGCNGYWQVVVRRESDELES